MSWLRIMVVVGRGSLGDRTELAAENLALRQQFPVLHRRPKRPSLRTRDRIRRVGLSRIWAGRRPAPSQTSRTFLDNHVANIVTVDFFTVPTATFRIFFAFVVLRHDRRMVVRFNATAHPTAEWTAQQIVEAFPYDNAPRFMIRDGDGTYGSVFHDGVRNVGIEEVIAAARSPWQNPYVERLIGSIRRDCLDHVIVLNEPHLRRILRS